MHVEVSMVEVQLREGERWRGLRRAEPGECLIELHQVTNHSLDIRGETLRREDGEAEEVKAPTETHEPRSVPDCIIVCTMI